MSDSIMTATNTNSKKVNEKSWDEAATANITTFIPTLTCLRKPRTVKIESPEVRTGVVHSGAGRGDPDFKNIDETDVWIKEDAEDGSPQVAGGGSANVAEDCINNGLRVVQPTTTASKSIPGNNGNTSGGNVNQNKPDKGQGGSAAASKHPTSGMTGQKKTSGNTGGGGPDLSGMSAPESDKENEVEPRGQPSVIDSQIPNSGTPELKKPASNSISSQISPVGPGSAIVGDLKLPGMEPNSQVVTGNDRSNLVDISSPGQNLQVPASHVDPNAVPHQGQVPIRENVNADLMSNNQQPTQRPDANQPSLSFPHQMQTQNTAGNALPLLVSDNMPQSQSLSQIQQSGHPETQFAASPSVPAESANPSPASPIANAGEGTSNSDLGAGTPPGAGITQGITLEQSGGSSADPTSTGASSGSAEPAGQAGGATESGSGNDAGGTAETDANT